MQLLFGGAHIGPLAHQLRRQRQWQFLGQMQRIELEGLLRHVSRQAPGKCRDQVALLRQLLLQQGQLRPRLRQYGKLRGDVGFRHCTQLCLTPGQIERFLFQAYQLFGGPDLGT